MTTPSEVAAVGIDESTQAVGSVRGRFPIRIFKAGTVHRAADVCIAFTDGIHTMVVGSEGGQAYLMVDGQEMLSITQCGALIPAVDVSADYTMAAGDQLVRANTITGPVVVRLTPFPLTGQVARIKKITSNANSLTVHGNGNLVEGLTSLGTGATIDLATFAYRFNGTAWESLE